MSKTASNELARLRKVSVNELAGRSQQLRLEILDVISHAPMGHYSSSLSCAEILVTLYHHVLRLRTGEPDWPGVHSTYRCQREPCLRLAAGDNHWSVWQGTRGQ